MTDWQGWCCLYDWGKGGEEARRRQCWQANKGSWRGRASRRQASRSSFGAAYKRLWSGARLLSRRLRCTICCRNSCLICRCAGTHYPETGEKARGSSVCIPKREGGLGSCGVLREGSGAREREMGRAGRRLMRQVLLALACSGLRHSSFPALRASARCRHRCASFPFPCAPFGGAE